MREYRVWRKDEERALRKGVTKHGTGAWEMIRTDAEFADTLKNRTGVQLKDKWRNLVKFNHLSPEEMKASCGGSARTRSGLRQRAAQRSLSPGSQLPRASTRRVVLPGPYATTHVETSPMAASQKESLLGSLKAACSQITAGTPDRFSAGSTDSTQHAGATCCDTLDAVNMLIECVQRGAGCAGTLRLPRYALQRCPESVAALVGHHLPQVTADLLPEAGGVGAPKTSTVSEAVMAGAAKAAKATLEHAAAPSTLGTPLPAAAVAAASLSPARSPQNSGEMQRKRSRGLTCMDEAETKPAAVDDGEEDERNVRQVAAVITTGDMAGRPAAAAASRGRPLTGRAVHCGAPHRRRHSVGRVGRTLSARDLMMTGMRDSGKRAALSPFESTRLEGADSASEHSAAHVEDDFLQSLYRNCFSKHGDSSDALLYAPSPCPPSPTWGSQPQYAAPTRASAPQLPIGCNSPPRQAYMHRTASTSVAAPLHRPGSISTTLCGWPSTSLGVVSSGTTPSPPHSGSSAGTVGPAACHSNAFGVYSASGHGQHYGGPSSGVSHPSSVSSLIAPDNCSSPGKGALPNTMSTASAGSYAPMDTAPPLQAQLYPAGPVHNSSRTADTSGLELLLGWGPQPMQQPLPSNGCYPCMHTAAGPPMSMTGFGADVWSLPTMCGVFPDDQVQTGGAPASPCGGPSEGSGSAGGSFPGTFNPSGQRAAFADMTDPYGASLFPRGDFQGVLDSLNELDSCYDRAAPEAEDLFPSCRSTMSFV
eukprot:jgi/Ulvmu1/10636/UM066_0015.1